MAHIVHTDCCWYVGDEDCHKCLLRGLLFNCVNCESYDDPHACDEAPASANDRQMTGKLNIENEYEAKVKELENAIEKCEKAEEDFKKRTCKFRSQKNCDFCSFHSDCEEHWKEGDEE